MAELSKHQRVLSREQTCSRSAASESSILEPQPSSSRHTVSFNAAEQAATLALRWRRACKDVVGPGKLIRLSLFDRPCLPRGLPMRCARTVAILYLLAAATVSADDGTRSVPAASFELDVLPILNRPRLQSGGVPRQGPRAERVSAFAAGVRSGFRLCRPDAAGPRPAGLSGGAGAEPAAAKGDRPRCRTAAACGWSRAAPIMRCCCSGSPQGTPRRAENEPKLVSVAGQHAGAIPESRAKSCSSRSPRPIPTARRAT